MKPSLLRLLAAVSLLLAVPLGGATRPHYGGTLRVVWRARLSTLDFRQWPSDPSEAMAMERAAALVFDRLVGQDENGAPEPELAVAWKHDAGARRWTIRLRTGVEFSDGTPLTAETVASALQFPGLDRTVTATGDGVVIEGKKPMPDLLAELASLRHAIFRVQPDGSLIGTGPFRVVLWQPGSRATLAANERDWRGRPRGDQRRGCAPPGSIFRPHLVVRAARIDVHCIRAWAPGCGRCFSPRGAGQSSGPRKHAHRFAAETG